MKSAAPIAFDYRPSRTLAAALAGVALVAAAAPWASAAPTALRIALSFLAVAVAVAAARAYLAPRFRRIAHGAAGWRLVDAGGREQAALLVAHRRLGAAVMLDFRIGVRARFRVLLLPDNLDHETRRRLLLVLARGEDVAVDGPA